MQLKKTILLSSHYLSWVVRNAINSFSSPFEMQLVIPAALKAKVPLEVWMSTSPGGIVPTLSNSFVVPNPSVENVWWPFVPRPHYDTDGKENESQRSHLEVRHCVL
ncbi:hypothetical protein CDAR_510241 [Caerostris darwini]|uniref:Uncharacterized protein n=1 Tax=Caerostris darwini TaxID=1538125 RepID=A0AAV4P4B1_9ARAC|nr:hypothetical protein CDAR_510241 [Caerostris darwini]